MTEQQKKPEEEKSKYYFKIIPKEEFPKFMERLQEALKKTETGIKIMKTKQNDTESVHQESIMGENNDINQKNKNDLDENNKISKKKSETNNNLLKNEIEIKEKIIKELDINNKELNDKLNYSNNNIKLINEQNKIEINLYKYNNKIR